MSEGPAARCSFCGKTQDDVRTLIAGPGVYICDECVDLCTDIVGAQTSPWTRAWRAVRRRLARRAMPRTPPSATSR